MGLESKSGVTGSGNGSSVFSCKMVANHGLLGQNGNTAMTMDVYLLSLARNLAIREIGGKIYPKWKLHGW